MFSTRIWKSQKKGLKPLWEGVEGQTWGHESMARLLHEAQQVLWTWQKSCPGMAFFRHCCPALVSPWHGDRGDSKDLWRRDPSAPQEAPNRAVPPLAGHWLQPKVTPAPGVPGEGTSSMVGTHKLLARDWLRLQGLGSQRFPVPRAGSSITWLGKKGFRQGIIHPK